MGEEKAHLATCTSSAIAWGKKRRKQNYDWSFLDAVPVASTGVSTCHSDLRRDLRLSSAISAIPGNQFPVAGGRAKGRS